MSIKSIILTDGGVIDVSSYAAILWSYGNNARKIISDRQLDCIDLIVDKDENKGNETCIRGRRCRIVSPNNFKTLPYLDNRFIIIGSELYSEEICNDILNTVGERYLICKDSKDYVSLYTSIKDCLLLDPVLNRKIYEGHCSKLLIECKNVAEKMVSTLDKSKCKYYSPIDQGHKLSICIRDDEYIPRFVFQFSFWGEWDWRISPMEEDVFQSVQSVYDKLNINDGLTVSKEYDSNARWCAELMHAGISKLAFGWENMRGIIKKLKSIHNSGQKVNVSVEPWSRVDFLRNKIDINRYQNVQTLFETIDATIKDECNSYVPCLTHGDFHHGNIIGYKGEPFIIDWESMCMSDPIYDVSRLVFYLRNCGIKTINDDAVLGIYYEGTFYTAQRRHFKAMMIFSEYIEYLLQLIDNRDVKKLEQNLLESIEQYKGEFIK